MIVKKYYLNKHFNTRRGEKIEEIKYIVITSSKYNGFSALKNRNIIERSKYNEETEFSCHYIIGVDGKVLQIIPTDEMTICTKKESIDLNSITIMLTKDNLGQYSKKELNSLKKLIARLIKKYDIKRDNVILEYDINCSRRPEFFVDERILLEEIVRDDKKRGANI